jgi:phage-related minor tail protein
LERVKGRIEVIAAEMKAQELEHQAKRQQTDQEAERIKNQISAQKVEREKTTIENQLLTKAEPKGQLKRPENPQPQPTKKTLSERERDRKNAKRRAKYQLKKMLTSAANDNQKNSGKAKPKK